MLSRFRFIHWLQDVPDQAAILRQYCRYSGEVKSGRNIKQMVNRALEMAMSDPKGPSYLMAAREVLEEVGYWWPPFYKILLTECVPRAWKESGLRKSY